MTPSRPLVAPNGVIFIRWKLSWRERLRLLWKGALFSYQVKPDRGVHPVQVGLVIPPDLPDYIQEARASFETLKQSRQK